MSPQPTFHLELAPLGVQDPKSKHFLWESHHRHLQKVFPVSGGKDIRVGSVGCRGVCKVQLTPARGHTSLVTRAVVSGLLCQDTQTQLSRSQARLFGSAPVFCLGEPEMTRGQPRQPRQARILFW